MADVLAFRQAGRVLAAFCRRVSGAAARRPVGGCRRGPAKRFATADFARLAEGGWLLLEVGDGQVSGLPDRADAKALYEALFRAEVVRRP